SPLRLERGLYFREVTYTWPGRPAPAIRELDLELARGTLTVLRGPSGSGKSTLADLVAGLIRPDSGAILVDGEKLDGDLLARWRGSVAYVPQHPYLFDGTVAENLSRYNPGSDRKAMEECLRLARADFVFALPGGLDARIGDGGAALSGGERQRLVLARALLKRSDFLILDEATNALDEENHEAVLEAVASVRGQKTILLISHGSLEARHFADRILRMEAGRVVEQDS
ncbi:MAG TPA: ABC transporter ATP-binding protein, partial [Rectinemataceae bacterium]